MKNVLLFLITVYQRFVSPCLKQLLGISSMCRFSPTCSAYAKHEIKKEGVIKGSGKSLIRLLRCQPFSN